jgi:hypothetical protein
VRQRAQLPLSGNFQIHLLKKVLITENMPFFVGLDITQVILRVWPQPVRSTATIGCPGFLIPVRGQKVGEYGQETFSGKSYLNSTN